MTSSKKSTIIILTLTSLIILAAIYFFILPTWQNYTKTTKEIAQKDTELTQIKREVVTYSKLAKQKDQIALYSQKTSNLVPAEPELETFMVELEALIAQSKIPQAEFHLASLTAGTTTTNNPSVLQDTKNYQIIITGTSSLANIINFTNQLKTLSRLTETTALDINTTDKNDSIGFSLTGNIFSEEKKPSGKLLNPSKILSEAIAKITDYQTYGQNIEVQKEEGFGRPNPFTSY
ncbi:MAG: hypothetical protein Q7S37_04430 [bacterium]|nr:hypothetical protein [bacterium]